MKVVSLFIGVAFALTGVLQTFLYLRLKKHFLNWPVVAAKITHSRLLNQTGPDGKKLLEAIIYFTYDFRGKSYKTNTPALRGYDLFPSLEYERALVKKYRAGDMHNIRVHPALPRVAYLEVAPLSVISTVLAPVFTLGGIALIVAYFYGVFDFLGFV